MIIAEVKIIVSEKPGASLNDEDMEKIIDAVEVADFESVIKCVIPVRLNDKIEINVRS